MYKTLSLAFLALLIISPVLAEEPTIAEESTVAEKPARSFDEVYSAYEASMAIGDHFGGVTHAEEAWNMGRELFGKHSFEYATLGFNYGRILNYLNRHEDARPVLQESMELHRRLYGDSSPEMIDVLMALGEASGNALNDSNQEGYYREALELAETQYGKDSRAYGILLVETGAGLMDESQSADGRKYLLEGHKILERELGREHARTGQAAFYLGKYELGREKYGAATEWFEKALVSFSDPERPDNSVELTTHAFLVKSLTQLGREDEATQHCLAIGRMTPQDPNQEMEPLFRVAPEYPRSALVKGDEGSVKLSFVVDEMGFVRNPAVLESSSFEMLDQAAIDAMLKYRFAPRFEDGMPVSTESTQTMTFEITSG